MSYDTQGRYGPVLKYRPMPSLWVDIITVLAVGRWGLVVVGREARTNFNDSIKNN
jgi:hypothetical protein